MPATQSSHKRAQEEKHRIADLIEEMLEVTGYTRRTRDGDKGFRVRIQSSEDHAPVYVRISLVGEA